MNNLISPYSFFGKYNDLLPFEINNRNIKININISDNPTGPKNLRLVIYPVPKEIPSKASLRLSRGIILPKKLKINHHWEYPLKAFLIFKTGKLH